MNGARLLVAVSILMVGCGGGAGQTANSGQSEPAGAASAGAGATSAAAATPAAGGGSGSSLLDAAAAVKDVCTIMPMDLAATIVPGAAAPRSDQFPPGCMISNGPVALQVVLGAYDSGGPVSGAESIPGLAAGAYLEHLTSDNTYLTVLLDADHGALYVTITNPDNKDHRDEAIAVANAVLAKLR